MKYLRLLLLPLSLIYGIIVRLRNLCFDLGLISSYQPTVPTISLGNLSIGGTGKSPHLEYLINLLQHNKSIATLSRGYGRKSSGFKVVDEKDDYHNVGDEPLQFKKKFNNVVVAVDADRTNGIKRILHSHPNTNIILLDDAFQHRKVKPGLSILLTDYHHPFYKDFILPGGDLREPRSAYERADIIVVTKIPDTFLEGEKENIIKSINPLKGQNVFFSKIIYGDFCPITQKAIGDSKVIKEFFFDANYSIVLFTGIANSKPLYNYLCSKVTEVIRISFKDHHPYSTSDIKMIRKTFERVEAKNKILLTTEKDSTRLNSKDISNELDMYPMYYLPIKIEMLEGEEESFTKTINNYVNSN